MPSVTFRCSEAELARLKRQADGSVSAFVRERLFSVESSRVEFDAQSVLDDHERRLSRLEEMAGL